MRSIFLSGGLVLTFAFIMEGYVAAAPLPYTTTVTQEGAEVRSGRSMDSSFYATNRLHRGDTVEVIEEYPDGWLGIRPPKGSFSWVGQRFLRPLTDSIYSVSEREVPVLIGSEVVSTPPQVKGATLLQGAQVRRYQQGGSFGQPLVATDGNWMLPIEPPAKEIRYIRSEAVTKAPGTAVAAVTPVAAGAGQLAAAQRPTPETSSASNGAAIASIPAPGSQPVPAAGTKPTHAEIDELYARAYQAEKAGKITEAVQLYAQVGALGLPINHQYALVALRRADFLLGGAGAGVAATPAAYSQVHPMVATPQPPMSSVQLSRPATPSSPVQPTSGSGPMFTTSRQSSDNGTPSYQWIGQLRRSGRSVGNQPTYVLDSNQGSPILYANPSAGVDLESHVGQKVELLGNAVYYGQLNSNYMVVTQVRPIQ